MRFRSALPLVHASAGVLLTLALLPTLVFASSNVTAYNVSNIIPPGSDQTVALALNKTNAVVGWFTASGAVEGFELKGTKYTIIVAPGSSNFSRANGINDSGLIAGDFYGTDGFYHGFTLKGKKYTQFDVDKGVVSTSIFGLNNNGDLAGAAGVGGPNQGFVAIAGTVTEFYAKDTDDTYANAINNSDVAVGQYYDSSSNTHGFSRDASGTITLIDYPGATQTACLGINDAGTIAGYYVDSVGQAHGFLDTAGVFTSLPFFFTGGINNAGDMTGYYVGPGAPGGVRHGYLATPKAFASFSTVTVPGSIITDIYGINKSKAMVGWYRDSGGTEHGLLYAKNKVTNIDDPAAQPHSTQALGINTSGQIVGVYTSSGGSNLTGFLYSGGTFTDIVPPGGSEVEVSGINDAGVICGVYTDSSNAEVGFILSGSTYTTVNVPGSNYTWAWDQNASGKTSVSFGDVNGFNQSAIYDGTNYTPVNVPGAYNTYGHTINTAGNMVFTWSDGSLNYHGAILLAGKFYVFDAPGSVGTFADGINDSGEISGNFQPTSSTNHQGFMGKL